MSIQTLPGGIDDKQTTTRLHGREGQDGTSGADTVHNSTKIREKLRIT